MTTLKKNVELFLKIFWFWLSEAYKTSKFSEVKFVMDMVVNVIVMFFPTATKSVHEFLVNINFFKIKKAA